MVHISIGPWAASWSPTTLARPSDAFSTLLKIKMIIKL